MYSSKFRCFSYESFAPYLLSHFCRDKSTDAKRHNKARKSERENKSSEDVGKIGHDIKYDFLVF